MATFPYTGRLTDFAEQPFPNALPRLTVAGERSSFGPTGLLSERPVVLEVAADGSFVANLVPTVQTSPQIRYLFKCSWFTINQSGREVSAGWSEWTITAAIGGGPVKDMVTAPASVWFVGPPWPAKPVVGAFYLDRTGDQPYARYEG